MGKVGHGWQALPARRAALKALMGWVRDVGVTGYEDGWMVAVAETWGPNRGSGRN